MRVEWISGVMLKRLGVALASFALWNLASLCLWPAIAHAQILTSDPSVGGERAERVTEGTTQSVEDAAGDASKEIDDASRTVDRRRRSAPGTVEGTTGTVEDIVERTSGTVDGAVERTPPRAVEDIVERTSGAVERTARRTIDAVEETVERGPGKVVPPTSDEPTPEHRTATSGSPRSAKVATDGRRVASTASAPRTAMSAPRAQGKVGAARGQSDRRELEAEDDTGAVAAAGDEVKTPAVAGIRIQAERPRPEAAPGGVLAMTGSSLLLLAALGLFNILFGTGGLALGRRRGVVSVAAMPGLGWATRARRPIRSKGWWFRSGSHR